MLALGSPCPSLVGFAVVAPCLADFIAVLSSISPLAWMYLVSTAFASSSTSRGQHCAHIPQGEEGAQQMGYTK